MLLGCHRYTPEEYVKKVNAEPNYQASYTDGRHSVTCRYLPLDYMSLLESINSQATKKEKEASFLQAKKGFENSSFFSLTLSSEDGSDVLMENVLSQEDYAARLNFMTYHMDKSFFIVRPDGDTVRPVTYEYQRSYGNSPNSTFLFSFPVKSSIQNGDRDLQFFYKDYLLGIGQVVRLTFDNQTLQEDNIKLTF